MPIISIFPRQPQPLKWDTLSSGENWCNLCPAFTFLSPPMTLYHELLFSLTCSFLVVWKWWLGRADTSITPDQSRHVTNLRKTQIGCRRQTLLVGVRQTPSTKLECLTKFLVAARLPKGHHCLNWHWMLASDVNVRQNDPRWTEILGTLAGYISEKHWEEIKYWNVKMFSNYLPTKPQRTTDRREKNCEDWF